MVICFFSVALVWWCFFSTVSSECEVGLPRVPSDFAGSLLRPGIQIITKGLSFNRSADIRAIHLGGVCSSGRCFGEFQVWRPINQSTFSLLHTYLFTVQPTAPTYFSTSVPISGTPLSVESGDVIGFSAPNNDARSEGIAIATSSTSDTRYTLFEFDTSVETAVIDAASLTRTQAIPLISAEDDCTPSTSVQTPLSIPPDPPSPPVAAIGGAVSAVVVVVLVLILSVVVAVCAVKKKRKNRFGNTHVQDPSTIGVNEDEMYTSLKQPTPVQDKVYTELNTHAVYTSLDPQTTRKDGEYTHVLTEESTLDLTPEVNTHAVYTSLDPQTTQKDGEYTHVLTKESAADFTPTQQCTPHSRVVGGGAHSTSGDKLYTALDPQTTQSDTTYTPLNGAGLQLNHDTYIDVVNGHEGEAVYVETRTPQEQMMLSSLKTKIPSRSLTLGTAVHRGAHTTVYIAKMRRPNDLQEEVAVKLVKEGAPSEYTLRLLEEAAILQELQHHHILPLVGVVDGVDRVMMVTEYLSTGSLERYLTCVRTNPSELSSPDLPSLLLQFCKQVVDGLACLARKSFVHRDIAARNILLDKDLNCKISDFGMTRDLEDDNYYSLKQGSKIPLKWTAPETLFYKKYSIHSDIWSYGMLMYEIWSVGHKPFDDVDSSEMVRLLHNNYCLPPPPGCPRAVYEVMVKCWNYTPRDRPSAEDILGDFCRSERQLLSWKGTDVVSSSSKTLGAPLSEGRELYRDLQCTYTNA